MARWDFPGFIPDLGVCVGWPPHAHPQIWRPPRRFPKNPHNCYLTPLNAKLYAFAIPGVISFNDIFDEYGILVDVKKGCQTYQLPLADLEVKDKYPPQFGKLPPLYRFILNPFPDVCFSTCPECSQKTLLRKVPLAVHVDSHQ